MRILLVIPYCLLCALLAVSWWIEWTARAVLAWGIRTLVPAWFWLTPAEMLDAVRARLER